MIFNSKVLNQRNESSFNNLVLKKSCYKFSLNKLKTSYNKHDWTPAKYLNDLHHNRKQSTCDNFFLIYCKNVTKFLFWVFWTCMATSIKKDNTNLQKLWRLSACQKWPPFLTYFLKYCKNIANLLLWVIWECLIISINNDNINLVGNFDAPSVS